MGHIDPMTPALRRPAQAVPRGMARRLHCVRAAHHLAIADDRNWRAHRRSLEELMKLVMPPGRNEMVLHVDPRRFDDAVQIRLALLLRTVGSDAAAPPLPPHEAGAPSR